MFEKLLNVFRTIDESKKDGSDTKISAKELTEKEIATLKKEPYIKVIDTQFDRNNPSNGFFELDWNEYFIADLKRAGYTGTNDEEIVDKWFRQLCQNIISETNSTQEVRIV